MFPPGVGGRPGDVPTASGAERARPRRTTLETAQAAECGCVRIGLGDHGPPADDSDAFSGGVAAQAFRANLVRAVRLFTLVLEVADQATPPDPEQQDLSNA